jgi:hypothetical protein
MKIEIEITEEDAALIEEFLDENQSETGNSHGPLDMIILAGMLLEDVALAVRRPGSWEGSNMSQILCSHGYRV